MSKYYRPLPEELCIKKNMKLSKETGNYEHGLYSTKVIYQDEILGITHIKHSDFQDGLIRTPLGGFFNHSDRPNCILVEDGNYLQLKTIKEIYKGEEITVKYTTYDPTK
ncbi:SET domain-containing protein-lysine N-methyltransferase [bacterium]|nr:SET domain-containing protein-lysine N-methyltransferase [bacterium]